jgi:hypothetical protein
MQNVRPVVLSLAVLLFHGAGVGQDMVTVRDALSKVGVLEIPAAGIPVEHTVAREFQRHLSPGSEIRTFAADADRSSGAFRISVVRGEQTQEPGWYRLRVAPDGSGELTASHAHLLYAGFCRMEEEWSAEPVAEFARGRTSTVHVPWLEGEDGFFSGRPRYVRNYDPEATIRELARLGCSHVTINVLASPSAYEEGPPGEIYYRFYESSPDLDQFVETDLNRGLYPPEYLQANLNLLKKNAALALAYGLTPGLKVCSPRSMPEAFFLRYPYLRGARVDHPYRSYRPRYTATLSHPVVRWHYAQLMREIMKEVPELGYLYLWTNDSGSGFEYVSTLYAGRNGGAYLVREWKSDSAIARAAGENVLRYLRLLRDAASETNPQFRVIAALSWFGSEQRVILDGMGERIDLHVQPGDTAKAETWSAVRAAEDRGSRLFASASAVTNFILGGPCPWLVDERLRAAESPGVQHLAVKCDPPSLVPWSINREVVRAFQTGAGEGIDDLVKKTARRWCGPEDGDLLVRVWRLSDQAIRAMPEVPLYGNSWAFPLYRHWVRPFVPDIQRIPEQERAYYERHMISTFNNPTLIDFGADALWRLMDRTQGASIVEQCDRDVFPQLDGARALLQAVLAGHGPDASSREILEDQHDRLIALRCYFRTLRNIGGWISGVYGFLEESSPEKKGAARRQLVATIDDEIHNTEDLLDLWKRTSVEVIPVASLTENFALYGENLGELLQKKIALMRKHRADTPALDPNFMWRTGLECPVPEEDYLGY